MRFAIGSVPQLEQFMSGINMGDIAQGATDLRSREKAAGIDYLGKVGGAGLRAKGTAISGEVLGEATANAGRDRMFGSFINTGLSLGGGAMNAHAKANNLGIYKPKGGSNFQSFVPGTDRYYYQDAGGGIYPTP